MIKPRERNREDGLLFAGSQTVAVPGRSLEFHPGLRRVGSAQALGSFSVVLLDVLAGQSWRR